MLALLAYLRYVEAPSWHRSLTVGVAMAFGLLAKPMLVSLPVVFLLLDYWPLGRFSLGGISPDAFLAGKPWRAPEKSWIVIREKIPFLALSGVFCVITLAVQWQGRALRTFADYSVSVVPSSRPCGLRCLSAQDALASRFRSLLSLSRSWPASLASGLCGTPAERNHSACLEGRLRRPYLLMGWLWYLVTLIPVIGLIKVGDHAYADRYTYLPLVGIFIMLAWGVPDLIKDWRGRKVALAALAVSTLVACLAITRVQIGYWKDDIRLWEHALKVSPDNYMAHNNLGSALLDENRIEKAVEHFAAAVALNPRYDPAQYNLALGLVQQGKQAQAVQRLQIALEVDPDNDFAHVLLGRLNMSAGQVEEAANHFREVLCLRPDNVGLYLFLGQALMDQGNLEEAAQQFAEGTRLAPDNSDGHHQLGIALGRLQRWREAAASFERRGRSLPQE